MHNFVYREPETLEEALALLDELGEDAKIVAGGTALVIMLNQRLLMPSHLISLRKLPDIDGIESLEGALQLGALATHRAVETSPVVEEQCPVLAETYAQVATLRVRNMATVGGSLAHADPNQDPPVTLMALDARVGLASAQGTREVPLDEFFTDYYETVVRSDEVVTRVVVPAVAAHTGSAYVKFLPPDLRRLCHGRRGGDGHGRARLGRVSGLPSCFGRCGAHSFAGTGGRRSAQGTPVDSRVAAGGGSCRPAAHRPGRRRSGVGRVQAGHDRRLRDSSH